MSKLTKTKIEWTDYVWNPVWGCQSNCPYCYARKIAKRFAKSIAKKEYQGYEYKGVIHITDFEKWIKLFAPVWIKSNFNREFPKKMSMIFVNSMSDIHWWKEEWMRMVLYKIKKYPQHIFQFLTKFPEVYQKYKFPENCWLGVSIDCIEKPTIKRLDDKGGMEIWTKIDVDDLTHLKSSGYNNLVFASFEPLLNDPEPYLEQYTFAQLDWVIIGAQTNPFRPPKVEWVKKIIKKANEFNIPVFMKPNLKPIWKKKLIQDFPIIDISMSAR